MRLNMFENKALRSFGLKGDELIGENYIMMSFITSTPRQMSEGSSQGK
jgi:hypothetical protein